MTSADLYQEIEINKNMDKNDLYVTLLKTYPKIKIDFAMYDLFQYIHTETKNTKKRKDQQTFRNELIDRYQHCIISNTAVEVCEACHIIPYSECEDKNKYNVDNGILLRCDLHKLFDNGSLKITQDQLVIIDNKILTNPKMKCYHEYHNKKIAIHKNSLPYLK